MYECTDEVNVMVLLDEKMIEHAKVFGSEYSVPALDNFKVSGNLNLPKTSAITLSNYLHTEEPEDPNCPIYQRLMDIDQDLTK